MQESGKNLDPEHLTIAMAYVPWQKNSKMYDNLSEAYKAGTIFPSLNKPFTGRRPKA